MTMACAMSIGGKPWFYHLVLLSYGLVQVTVKKRTAQKEKCSHLLREPRYRHRVPRVKGVYQATVRTLAPSNSLGDGSACDDGARERRRAGRRRETEITRSRERRVERLFPRAWVCSASLRPLFSSC